MSKTKTPEDRQITRDRMRFVKNKSSANLVYLAILLDVLFFVSVFKTDLYFLKLFPAYSTNMRNSTGFTPYYNILICGVSVVYNLAFMLAAFLASEGLKNYGKNFSYLAAVIGAAQIVRIFIIPLRYSDATKKFLEINEVNTPIMASGQATRCIIYLVASGVCLIAAAVINFIKCGELEAHMKSLESGKA